MRRRDVKGERCGVDGCRSKRYRLREDDQLYCTHGHLKEERSTEHFLDDDEWNSQGKITRKKRSEDDLASSSGSQETADPLVQYLQCFQEILQKQTLWLVREKGLPKEIEIVVRDLWAFRVRCLRPETRAVESDTETENEDSSSSRARELTSRPKPEDCVVLWYLASLLLRLPVTIADLHGWVATEGGLMYYQARKLLPKEEQDRVGKGVLHSLDAKELTLDKLQKAVYDTTRGYCETFVMQFPPLNYPLLLLRYMEDLAVPLEVWSTFFRLIRVVPCTFTYTFTARKPGHKRQEMPETMLAAYFVVAVKLLFPFPKNNQESRSPTGMGSRTINWHNWATAHAECSQNPRSWSGLDPDTFDKVKTVNQAAMQDTDIDNYLDWYNGYFVQPGDGYSVQTSEKAAPSQPQERNRNADNFMDGLSTALPMTEETAATLDQENDERLTRVLTSAWKDSTFPKRHEKYLNVDGSNLWYTQYRNLEELHGPALKFHEAVRRLAGISMESLLESVLGLEKELQIYNHLRKRGARDPKATRKGKERAG